MQLTFDSWRQRPHCYTHMVKTGFHCVSRIFWVVCAVNINDDNMIYKIEHLNYNTYAKSHLKCRFAKDSINTFLWIFFVINWQQNMRKTLQLICPLKCDTMRYDVFHLFWRYWPVVCALYKAQLRKMLLSQSIVGQELQTELLVLFGNMPDLFLGSSSRSLPFSCGARNKFVCLPCCPSVAAPQLESLIG